MIFRLNFMVEKKTFIYFTREASLKAHWRKYETILNTACSENIGETNRTKYFPFKRGNQLWKCCLCFHLNGILLRGMYWGVISR